MIACKGELIGWFMCFVLWDANLKLIMASRWPVVNIVLVWLRQPSSPLLELCAQFLSASNPLGINHQLVTTTEESGEFYWTFQSFAFAIRFRVLPWTCTILKLRQLNDRLTHIKTSIQCLQPAVSMNTFWYNTVTTDADLKERKDYFKSFNVPQRYWLLRRRLQKDYSDFWFHLIFNSAQQNTKRLCSITSWK